MLKTLKSIPKILLDIQSDIESIRYKLIGINSNLRANGDKLEELNRRAEGGYQRETENQVLSKRGVSSSGTSAQSRAVFGDDPRTATEAPSRTAYPQDLEDRYSEALRRYYDSCTEYRPGIEGYDYPGCSQGQAPQDRLVEENGPHSSLGEQGQSTSLAQSRGQNQADMDYQSRLRSFETGLFGVR